MIWKIGTVVPIPFFLFAIIWIVPLIREGNVFGAIICGAGSLVLLTITGVSARILWRSKGGFFLDKP